MTGYIGNKTTYSFLESAVSLERLIQSLKEKGFKEIILTDTQLHGSLQLFKLAKKYDIKPILGQYFTIEYNEASVNIYVTVKNALGYKNLLTLNRLSINHPIDLTHLEKYQQGLVITLSNYHQPNESSLHLLSERFDDVFFGVSDVRDMLQENVIFEKHVRYIQSTERIHYEDVMTISGKSPSPEACDLDQTYQDIMSLPQSFNKAYERFVTLHTFDLKFPTYHMPRIPLDEGVTPKVYLESLAHVGLKKRLKSLKKVDASVYIKRLRFELDIIIKMGFENYFLIVYDVIKYAKMQGIYVGPGRGSAAGSLVSYSLGITDVDPIAYHLMFERFLNPERVTMPDIDMDFPDDKRDEVIAYAYQRFGEGHVASIVTFTTFGEKSAIRDIAKVMGLSSQRATYLTKQIIANKIDPLDEEMLALKKRSEAILGFPRQTGTHPAGMLFSKENIHESIPVQEGPYPFYQTQFEASEVEKLGLLKMDFLGLRNLSIISKTVEMIQSTKEFSIHHIPLNDKKTFELLSQAKTQGIFQLESNGIRHVLRKLKPDHFEDLIALLALYRPGPMDFIDQYIERRHGKSYIPLHPLLKEVLKPTFGIIVYQEQIMTIAQQFAGYTLAEADLLRRGISKKDESILNKERHNFVSKSMKQGHKESDANDLYDVIVKFSDYGFNRSHSVAYAFVAYQMAYLKTNYPKEFLIALLNSIIGDDTHTEMYIKELLEQNIDVLSPDINLSGHHFKVVDGKIICPFNMIKSLGNKTVQMIIDERDQGPFISFDDVKKRLHKKINETHLKKLIDAGALDAFNHTHHTMHENISMDMIDYALYVKDFSYAIKEEYTYGILAEKEKEALGFNLKYQIKFVLDQHKLTKFERLSKEKSQWMAVQINKIKHIKTKNGQTMAFIQCTDGQNVFDVTMFPKTLEIHQGLEEKTLYKAQIRKNEYQEKTTFIVEKMIKIT